jgi:hypothetical protein
MLQSAVLSEQPQSQLVKELGQGCTVSLVMKQKTLRETHAKGVLYISQVSITLTIKTQASERKEADRTMGGGLSKSLN